MITCFVGTRAQLIKMAPVIVDIEERGLKTNLVFTGQHKETMDQLVRQFGIRTQGTYLYQGKEITGIFQMARWFVRCLWVIYRSPQDFIPKDDTRVNILLVHGDTFSTLLGAIAGRLRGIPVGHVEAGLRSYNLFHPFPEELTRLLVFRLSDVAFCPGDWAYENMRGYRLERVNIKGNTLKDALRIALASPCRLGPTLTEVDFGLCSIHRFENIFNKSRLQWILRLVKKAATRYRIIFVLHPATRKKLEKYGFMDDLENTPNVMLLPRMGYVEFVHLMQSARFVMTDGGGNQEELSYLGIPTLLIRRATERQEGIASTVTLSNYDEKIADNFLNNSLAQHSHAVFTEQQSPSKIIVDYIAQLAR